MGSLSLLVLCEKIMASSANNNNFPFVIDDNAEMDNATIIYTSMAHFDIAALAACRSVLDWASTCWIWMGASKISGKGANVFTAASTDSSTAKEKKSYY